jgi:hypothetical protein
MIQSLPLYISLLFSATVILTIVWFYIATKSKTFLLLAIGWVVVQTILGLSGIYRDAEAMPPKLILFGVAPAMLVIVVTFLTARGRAFIDRIDLKTITYMHSIRIPVEIVLALLFHQGFVSVLMTFEGTNFDMFSGITSPIVAYFAFRAGQQHKKLLFGWNILCLILLLNVVITAALAISSPFQQLAFDQPNVAIMYFPFNLLPTFVVPVVLFAHLVALRRLSKT